MVTMRLPGELMMKRIALACCLALGAAACEGRPDRRPTLPQPTPIDFPPAPEPPPAPPPPPAGFRLIQTGEKIMDSIRDEERRYAVATSIAGQMVTRLEWPLESGGAVTLRLELNGREIDWQCTSDAAWPVEGRVEVKAGEHVRIVVRRGPGCWDYRVAPLATEPFAFTVWAELEK
jgi:hypothetical protein